MLKQYEKVTTEIILMEIYCRLSLPEMKEIYKDRLELKKKPLKKRFIKILNPKIIKILGKKLNDK